MLVIRLVRVGRRNLAHFRIVVSEKRSKLGGKVVDLLGSYNPHKKELTGVTKEKVEAWVKQGAQVSQRAALIFNSLLGFDFKVEQKQKAPKKKVSVSTFHEATPDKASDSASEKATPDKVSDSAEASTDAKAMVNKTENSQPAQPVDGSGDNPAK
jgi:small subunit ribosomal protein S16